MSIAVIAIVIILIVIVVFVYGICCGWQLRGNVSVTTDQQVETQVNGLRDSLEMTRTAWETERQMWAEALRQLEQNPDQRP